MSKRDFKSLNQDIDKDLLTKLRRKNELKETNIPGYSISKINNGNIQNINNDMNRINNRDNTSLESIIDDFPNKTKKLGTYTFSQNNTSSLNPIDMTPEPTSSSNSRNLNDNVLTVRRNLNLQSNASIDLDQYNTLPLGMIDIDIEQSLKDEHYDPTYAKTIERVRRERESQCIIRNPDYVFLKGKIPIDDNKRNRIKSLQTLVTLDQRDAIVDWLIQLAIKELDMCSTSIFLTVQILDLIATRLHLDQDHLALLGLASLMIAGKVEEICPPNPELLVKLTGNTYTIEALVLTEQDILKLFDWKIVLPTRNQFMERMQLAGELNPRVKLLSNFIVEASLQDFIINQYAPSKIAAAAIHLARQMLMPLDAQLWTPMLQYYTTYDEKSLIPVVERLCLAYWSMVTILKDPHTHAPLKHPIYCRYNSPHRQHVARITALRPENLRFDWHQSSHDDDNNKSKANSK